VNWCGHASFSTCDIKKKNVTNVWTCEKKKLGNKLEWIQILVYIILYFQIPSNQSDYNTLSILSSIVYTCTIIPPAMLL